ncbi:unnamed protein product [Owenia fusiformis]|uniref:Uncharacterized protein n=1 Tax=Owenia fusiformis TaxID=6347 RepID=A0A8S4MW85_OWEFU|nr:unnamed protein product [Owenia fusiformis]
MSFCQTWLKILYPDLKQTGPIRGGTTPNPLSTSGYYTNSTREYVSECPTELTGLIVGYALLALFLLSMFYCAMCYEQGKKSKTTNQDIEKGEYGGGGFNKHNTLGDSLTATLLSDKYLDRRAKDMLCAQKHLDPKTAALFRASSHHRSGSIKSIKSSRNNSLKRSDSRKSRGSIRYHHAHRPRRNSRNQYTNDPVDPFTEITIEIPPYTPLHRNMVAPRAMEECCTISDDISFIYSEGDYGNDNTLACGDPNLCYNSIVDICNNNDTSYQQIDETSFILPRENSNTNSKKCSKNTNYQEPGVPCISATNISSLPSGNILLDNTRQYISPNPGLPIHPGYLKPNRKAVDKSDNNTTVDDSMQEYAKINNADQLTDNVGDLEYLTPWFNEPSKRHSNEDMDSIGHQSTDGLITVSSDHTDTEDAEPDTGPHIVIDHVNNNSTETFSLDNNSEGPVMIPKCSCSLNPDSATKLSKLRAQGTNSGYGSLPNVIDNNITTLITLDVDNVSDSTLQMGQTSPSIRCSTCQGSLPSRQGLNLSSPPQNALIVPEIHTSNRRHSFDSACIENIARPRPKSSSSFAVDEALRNLNPKTVIKLFPVDGIRTNGLYSASLPSISVDSDAITSPDISQCDNTSPDISQCDNTSPDTSQCDNETCSGGSDSVNENRALLDPSSHDESPEGFIPLQYPNKKSHKPKQRTESKQKLLFNNIE